MSHVRRVSLRPPLAFRAVLLALVLSSLQGRLFVRLPPEELRALRTLEVLQQINTREIQPVLQKLAVDDVTPVGKVLPCHAAETLTELEFSGSSTER